MKLNEVLELSYNKRGKKLTTIAEVYGIIYRIYCIPEKKSYIGQTYSHNYCGKYISRSGIIRRIKRHWRRKEDPISSNQALYVVLNKYEPEKFEVHEEQRLHGKELARINQIEGEYMQQYNCMIPNGYNFEAVGKRNTKLLRDLAKFHKFNIEDVEYKDTTRRRRCKDVCMGTYFNLPKQQLGQKKTLELLQLLEIERVRLLESKGLRILVKPLGKNVNIRIYFSGTREECLRYAQQISENVEQSESFRGDACYKYQTKVEKVLASASTINKVVGNIYTNKSRACQTYLLRFYGTPHKKSKCLQRVSFGGKTQNIQKSYEIAMDFIDRLRECDTTDHFEYNLKKIDKISQSKTGGCLEASRVNSVTA